MPVENIIAAVILSGASYIGYFLYPHNPKKFFRLITLILGPICALLSLILMLWLLFDSGSPQGSVGAWLLILSVGSLGIVAAFILGIFAFTGCFIAALKKRK